MEKCAFCGKTSKEVQRFLRGESALICETCVRLCNKVLTKDEKV
ncbi:MAG: ATP-dependent Clp protease ATP-binding subunit ClpX, partial [Candidatus Omnitrophica bacterium]|nr:ATP-dependent Clp protease ATP-binding subunit ClpX [Candidatus Omnitrophota bacterium]